MKQKLVRKIFAVLYFILLTATAQETLDCKYNLQEALFYLKGSEYIKKDSLKAIEFLKPCVKEGDSNAQLLMGRLYLGKTDKKNIQKGFNLIKKSAEQNNSIAAGDLGVLYKYGIGCKLNYSKARRWFEKGYELGNGKATYSLGYLYLKGLGNTEQDYSEAVKWFQKSGEYPMAKYWLGVCYLNGYGVQKNIQKANELLETNFEDTYLNTERLTIENEGEISNITIEDIENNTNFEDVTKEKLYGRWTGKLLKLDWSGTKIEQKFPLNIEVKYDSINNEIKYVWEINNEKTTGRLISTSDVIYFDDLKINLPHTSFNERIDKELKYQILSSDLAFKIIEETTYLTGAIESYIEKWNEPGVPMRLILTKEKELTENNVEISNEVLQALATQKNSFIKLYPNPFENDLIIAYTINITSNIKIKISSIDGLEHHIVEQVEQQKSGDYRYYFNSSVLKKGIYVVSIIVNDSKKTKLIVKN